MSYAQNTKSQLLEMSGKMDALIARGSISEEIMDYQSNREIQEARVYLRGLKDEVDEVGAVYGWSIYDESEQQIKDLKNRLIEFLPSEKQEAFVLSCKDYLGLTDKDTCAENFIVDIGKPQTKSEKQRLKGAAERPIIIMNESLQNILDALS